MRRSPGPAVIVAFVACLSVAGCAPVSTPEDPGPPPITVVPQPETPDPSPESTAESAVSETEYPHEMLLHATGPDGDTGDVYLRVGDPVPGDTVTDPDIHACDDWLSEQYQVTLARVLAIPVQIEAHLTSSMQAEMQVDLTGPIAFADSSPVDFGLSTVYLSVDGRACGGARFSSWALEPNAYGVAEWWVFILGVVSPNDPTGLAADGMDTLGFSASVALSRYVAEQTYEPGPGVVSCGSYRPVTYLTVNEAAALAGGCTLAQ